MKTVPLKYRMKTEEEFVRDLGDNWRHRVRAGWNYEMDKLLGRSLSEGIHHREFGWTISDDMITLDGNQILRYIISPCHCSDSNRPICPKCKGTGEITKLVTTIHKGATHGKEVNV